MLNLTKYRLPFFFLAIIFVLSVTFAAIKFNQGYRLDLTTKKFKPTGLLVASSSPAGAEILVNGKLITATNNTIILAPGTYQVEIRKNSFWPWQKELFLKKELVTSADAFLFPQIPDLKPLTFAGAENPEFSPDGTKIVYAIPLPDQKESSSSASLNNPAGLWIMDLSDSPFPFSREPRQIAKSVLKGRNFSVGKLYWSPDSRQILVEFSQTKENFLLDANQFNQNQALADITADLPNILVNWEKDWQARQKAKLKRFPEKLQEILIEKADNLIFSPDATKVLYVATVSATIPEELIPPVLDASTQKESRQIEEGKVYVYDIKEDRNFLVPFDVPKPTPTPKPKKTKITLTPTPPITHNPQLTTPRWFPTSRHLYWIDKNKVLVCEYDGTNQTTIYSGPFTQPFVFASPGANRLIVLTQLNSEPGTKLNLFEVSLR